MHLTHNHDSQERGISSRSRTILQSGDAMSPCRHIANVRIPVEVQSAVYPSLASSLFPLTLIFSAATHDVTLCSLAVPPLPAPPSNALFQSMAATKVIEGSERLRVFVYSFELCLHIPRRGEERPQKDESLSHQCTHPSHCTRLPTHSLAPFTHPQTTWSVKGEAHIWNQPASPVSLARSAGRGRAANAYLLKPEGGEEGDFEGEREGTS